MKKSDSKTSSPDSLASGSPSSASEEGAENVSNSPNKGSVSKKKKISHRKNKDKNSKISSEVSGDSLASMRPPNHRTPNETKKKKRITS